MHISGKMIETITQRNERIERVRNYTEKKLNFIENDLLPNKNKLEEGQFENQLRIVECFIGELSCHKESVQDYQKRIENLKERYQK